MKRTKTTHGGLRAAERERLELRHRLNAGRVAVEEQVDFFRKQMGRVKSEWKEDDTRVTFADFAISEKIFAILRRQFPGDHYCSEESNPLDEEIVLDGEFSWVLDPIDGTNNYAAGIPIAAISLALLQHGEPVYGYIYDHTRDLLVHGGPGLGIFENSNRLVVDPVSRDLEAPESDLTVAMHFPVSQEILNRIAPLLTRYRVRSIGSAALNLVYLANGRFDGAMDFNVKLWDIAAGYALCRAVGIEVTFLHGSCFPLQRFHAGMAPCPYYGGTAEFCRIARELL